MILNITKKLEKSVIDSYIPKEVEIHDLKFTVKQKLDYTQTVILVSKIVDSSIRDGVVNTMLVELMRVLTTIEIFTDIVVEQDKFEMMELYNIFNNSGIYQKVLDNIPKVELERINKLIDDKIIEVNKSQSNEQSIGNILIELKTLGVKLLSTIEDIYENGDMEGSLNEAISKLNQLEPDKLEYINKFMDLVEK